jgi:predicted Rossmann fold nucleotide-binding protein DprA/Smf involved in DNA uptake
MDGQSRIKFNPVTKEIEIEGSEKFVKTYFNKVQALISGTKEAVAKAPIKEKPIKAKPVKKAHPSKKAPVAKGKKPAKQSKKGSNVNTVLALIQNSQEGITTTELKEKTGLIDKQIWAVVYRTEKQGKIKKVKRGVYIGA